MKLLLKALLLTTTLILHANLSLFSQEQPTNWVMVILKSYPLRPELDQNQADSLSQRQMQLLGNLKKQKELWLAAPFEGTGGIYLFRGLVLDSVKHLMKNDPTIQAEQWQAEYYPLHIHKGSFCREPSGKFSPLHLLQFVPNIYKDNVRDAYRYDDYHRKIIEHLIQDPAVLFYATFGKNEGGVMIYKGASRERQISREDASILEGYLTTYERVVHLPLLTFCP